MPICVSVSSNVQLVCGRPSERRKIPSRINATLRQMA